MAYRSSVLTILLLASIPSIGAESATPTSCRPSTIDPALSQCEFVCRAGAPVEIEVVGATYQLRAYCGARPMAVCQSVSTGISEGSFECSLRNDSPPEQNEVGRCLLQGLSVTFAECRSVVT